MVQTVLIQVAIVPRISRTSALTTYIAQGPEVSQTLVHVAEQTRSNTKRG